MDNLIERLRESAAYHDMGPYRRDIREEAADRITSQSAEIARYREALEESATGWENVVELAIIAPQHVNSARTLAKNARNALSGGSHDAG